MRPILNQVVTLNWCRVLFWLFASLIYAGLVHSGELEGITKSNVNDFNKSGLTALHRAVLKPGSGSPENIKIIESLLELGADPNLRAKDRSLWSPLDLAVNGSLEVVKTLVENGATIPDYAGNGHALLSRASRNGSIFKYLLEQGANPNVTITKNQDITVFMSLISRDEMEMIEQMLKYGVDYDQINKRGRSPISTAVTKRNLSLIRLLAEQDVNLGGHLLLLSVSTRKPDMAIAKALLEIGVDINEQNEDGNSALHYAHYFGNQELVEFYIGQGANAQIRNKKGQTYLEMKPTISKKERQNDNGK